MILAGIGAALIGGWICRGSSPFIGAFWKNLMIFAGLQILMEIALVAVFVLTSDICRNYAAGISLGIGLSAFPAVLMEVIDRSLTGKGGSISQYWLVSRSMSCPYEGFTAGYVGETVLVCGIWLVLAIGVGIWHFSRTDIK